MDSVGAFEAKTHLSELLDRVRQGEKITITTRGSCSHAGSCRRNGVQTDAPGSRGGNAGVAQAD